MRSQRASRKSNLGPAREILARWAEIQAARADEPAVFSPDGAIRRTFAGVDAEADEIASRIAASGGDRRVIALQMKNSPSWIAALLGIWRAGGIVLLEDPGLAAGHREIAERVSGAQFRIADGATSLEIVMSRNPPADFGDQEPDLIKLTSGTSGEPRLVLFTAGQLLADCDQICETRGMSAADRNYGVIAFSHSYGFSNLVTPLIASGVPVVVAPDALPRAVLNGLAASEATVLPGVPPILRAMSGLEGDLPALRLCVSAGAPLTSEAANRFRERFGVKVHSFYGASECGGICYDREDVPAGVDGFVGTPMTAVELDFLAAGDATGQRIRVRGAAVGLGYFPPLPGDALGDGSFEPTDLLASSAGGFRIAGRVTDLINVGGRKVNPAEIERVLTAHPQVREAVAFGVADAARTEMVFACVVASGPLAPDVLREFCGNQLAPWQVPREMVFLDQIPLTPRGKISRRDLAARFGVPSSCELEHRHIEIAHPPEVRFIAGANENSEP